MNTDKRLEILDSKLREIREVVSTYGEENFYISFSGGKDSCFLHHLIDQAFPGNKIPRVFVEGLDFNMIRQFVRKMAETDDRIHIVRPLGDIKEFFKEKGKPFKSKEFSMYAKRFRRNSEMVSVRRYIDGSFGGSHVCPKSLKYVFRDDYSGPKVSDECGDFIKHQPLRKFAEEHNKKYYICGIMREEKGRREHAQVLLFGKKNRLVAFQPLADITEEFEKWYIDSHKVELCKIYYPPYSIKRSGCCGCPCSLHLDEELTILKEKFSEDYARSIEIFGDIYEEYRRIGYRLGRAARKNVICGQRTVDDYLGMVLRPSDSGVSEGCFSKPTREGTVQLSIFDYI